MSSSSDEDIGPEDVQREIIHVLQQYGEALLGEPKKKKVKKQRKHLQDNSQLTPSTVKRKRKKKKKGSKSDDFISNNLSNEVEQKDELTGKEKQIEKFKNVLGLTAGDIEEHKVRKLQKEQNEELGKEYQIVHGQKRPAPEIVVFEGSSKQKKKESSQSGRDSKASGDDQLDGCPSFNLKAARYEVQRFGIRGMDKKKKEKAQEALAIKLGAVPPKNPCINYKKLMEMRKKEKQEYMQEKEKLVKDPKFTMPGKKVKTKRRDVNNVGTLDGQIGRYRAGMQIISQKEIERIKRKRR